jgi:hypothetical protein
MKYLKKFFESSLYKQVFIEGGKSPDDLDDTEKGHMSYAERGRINKIVKSNVDFEVSSRSAGEYFILYVDASLGISEVKNENLICFFITKDNDDYYVVSILYKKSVSPDGFNIMYYRCDGFDGLKDFFVEMGNNF